MNIKKLPLATAVIGLFAATAFAAQAQETMQQDSTEVPAFEEIDTNADGAITTSEAGETWLANVFAQVDANGDGYISKSEYSEATG